MINFSKLEHYKVIENEHKWHILSSLGIFTHLPVSTGIFRLQHLNLVIKALSFGDNLSKSYPSLYFCIICYCLYSSCYTCIVSESIIKSLKFHKQNVPTICIRYSTIEGRCIAPRPVTEYKCGKRNPLYPIRTTSFVSNYHHWLDTSAGELRWHSSHYFGTDMVYWY
jgi:hypothetical protein